MAAAEAGVAGHRCRIFGSNTYLCATPQPGGCILVDPGLDREGIEAALAARGWAPRRILCTHGHFDHLGSAAYFQQRHGVEVLLHAADVPTMRQGNFLLMAFKMPQRMAMPEITTIAGTAGTLAWEGAPWRWRHTPGHTPGSCVFVQGERWFTGDTLFSRGMGLSRLAGEAPEQLRASLGGLWEELVAGRVIFPGHGVPAAAEAVRRENARLRQFLGHPPANPAGEV